MMDVRFRCVMQTLIVCVLFLSGLLCAEAAWAASAKPLLFLVAGQSNAAGTADKPSSIVVHSGAFWNGKEWVSPLRDPVFPARKGGFCPALAKAIADGTGRKVYIVNVAVGGTSSNAAYFKSPKKSWSAYGSLRGRAKSIYRKAVAHLDEPFEFGGVVWMQGGTDGIYYAKGLITLEDARQGIEDVLTWLTDSFGKVFVIGIGYKNGAEQYDLARETIHKTMRQVSGTIPHCYFASDMPIRLRSLGLMKGGPGRPDAHYLIRGYDMIGSDAGKFIAKHIAERQGRR
ncbi:MAG: hypothetical protein J5556_04785 [Deltaproteobacteria bacterium]|nr:hypothetical protein [Deltaproteobacteria bacterium]